MNYARQASRNLFIEPGLRDGWRDYLSAASCVQGEIERHLGAIREKILYFTAPWCKACVNLEPHIAKVKSAVPIEKVDASADPEMVEKYGVISLPTLVFLENDKEVDRTVGVSNTVIDVLYTFAGV